MPGVRAQFIHFLGHKRIWNWPPAPKNLLGSLNTRRFWANQKWAVFLCNMSSHHHICIVNCLFTSREDSFENLGETIVLAGKMFTFCFHGWVKKVACLCSLLNHDESKCISQLAFHWLRQGHISSQMPFKSGATGWRVLPESYASMTL